MADLDIPALLDKAADHIDRVGWHQGSLYDRERNSKLTLAGCPVCAIGAINVALHGEPTFTSEGPDAHDVADAVLEALGIEGLADWNDEPGRTQAEVTNALRDTAAALREEADRG